MSTSVLYKSIKQHHQGYNMSQKAEQIKIAKLNTNWLKDTCQKYKEITGKSLTEEELISIGIDALQEQAEVSGLKNVIDKVIKDL